MEWRNKLELVGVDTSRYIVCHIAGLSINYWPESYWRLLVERIDKNGISMVFTGVGAGQSKQVDRIINGLAHCVNFCDGLNWSEFISVIREAKAVICVDTVAAHIAGAVETPCAVITAGRWPYLWRPFGRQVKVLSLSLPCSPCHRNYGCVAMECICGVSVDQVQKAVMSLLKQAESSF